MKTGPNRTIFLYLALAGCCLLFPPSGKPIALVGSIVVVIGMGIARAWQGRHAVGVLMFLALLYVFLLVVSVALHYVALSALHPAATITVKGQSAAWGLTTLRGWDRYVLFPLLLLSAVHLFDQIGDRRYMLLWSIPLVLIPSVGIAGYQYVVDIDFMNRPFFAAQGRVSGLGTDPNGFGMAMFLALPLALLGAFTKKGRWARMSFVCLSAAFAIGAVLSGARTAVLGVVLFLVVAPWLWIVARPTRVQVRWVLALLPVVLIALGIVAAGTIFSRNIGSDAPRAVRKLAEDVGMIRTTGLSEGARSSLEKAGRTELWRQAKRLIAGAPWSGWGPGGFTRNLQNTRFKNGESEEWMDNAENHYYQVGADLGIVGALVNLLLHVLPLVMVLGVWKKMQDSTERLAVVFCFSTVVILLVSYVTGPHTLAIDALWILVVLLAFLFVTSVRHGSDILPLNREIGWGVSACVGGLLIAFMWGTYNVTYGSNGYSALRSAEWWPFKNEPFKYEKNCYGIESWDGKSGRWCTDDAYLQIRLHEPIPRKIEVTLFVANPDIRTTPVLVTYGGKSGPSHEVLFRDHQRKLVQIPVREEDILEFREPSGQNVQFLVMSLSVSRTWVPAEWKVNEDTRSLGVAVLLP